MGAQEGSGLRVAWVIPKLTAGGIGSVAGYAAEGVARLAGWSTTVLSLHEPVQERVDAKSGVRYVSLGLADNGARDFLTWLRSNPQDVVITNDVSKIEPAFSYIPQETLHIIQIHDSLHRYRGVALRNRQFADGVICVAKHIETAISKDLLAFGYHGVLSTVHNGARFPAVQGRSSHPQLRLLFIGQMDAFKGIFDLVPIMAGLKKIGVPVSLTIVGGHHQIVSERLKAKRLNESVTWIGRVPHSDCYNYAADSDVLLMLSRREAFGMVTIETMAMGCVPIAYDITSGSRDIIEHGKNGFLLPFDVRSWLATISMLNSDRKRLQALSLEAINRVRCHFSEMTMATQLVSFIRSVQIRAVSHPSVRKRGLPPEAIHRAVAQKGFYHRFPHGIRLWIRNHVGLFPRLSYWLLNR